MAEAVFTQPNGQPLQVWIEPTVRVRGPKPKFFNLIRVIATHILLDTPQINTTLPPYSLHKNGGGEVTPVVKNAHIIIAERGTPEAKQHVLNWHRDDGKTILDKTWVYVRAATIFY